MAVFPKGEGAITALADSIVGGLAGNPAVYPASPCTSGELLALKDAFIEARNAAIAAQAATNAAYTAKEKALAALMDGMKTVLRYAENAVHRDDSKLALLGWGAPAKPTAASALAKPGQPRTLEAPRQGPDWLFLGWKAPLDGDPVTAYRIQRRLLPDGVWTDVGMSLECGTMLGAQERGKELEYRVIGVNKAGDGEASNTVTAVL